MKHKKKTIIIENLNSFALDDVLKNVALRNEKSRTKESKDKNKNKQEENDNG